jgi:hypothetical protein
MSRRNRAAEPVPSQNEYFHASEARETLAGNIWRAKFETMASPDSRSERGLKLQNGWG